MKSYNMPDNNLNNMLVKKMIKISRFTGLKEH